MRNHLEQRSIIRSFAFVGLLVTLPAMALAEADSRFDDENVFAASKQILVRLRNRQPEQVLFGFVSEVPADKSQVLISYHDRDELSNKRDEIVTNQKTFKCTGSTLGTEHLLEGNLVTIVLDDAGSVALAFPWMKGRLDYDPELFSDRSEAIMDSQFELVDLKRAIDDRPDKLPDVKFLKSNASAQYFFSTPMYRVLDRYAVSSEVASVDKSAKLNDLNRWELARQSKLRLAWRLERAELYQRFGSSEPSTEFRDDFEKIQTLPTKKTKSLFQTVLPKYKDFTQTWFLISQRLGQVQRKRWEIVENIHQIEVELLMILLAEAMARSFEDDGESLLAGATKGGQSFLVQDFVGRVWPNASPNDQRGLATAMSLALDNARIGLRRSESAIADDVRDIVSSNARGLATNLCDDIIEYMIAYNDCVAEMSGVPQGSSPPASDKPVPDRSPKRKRRLR